MKNLPLFILIAVVCVLNFVDLALSWNLGGLETNPLYLFTGTMWSLFLVKVGFSILIIILYFVTFKRNWHYYLCILTLLLCIGLFTSAIYGASTLQNASPEALAALEASLDDKEKMQYYLTASAIFFYLPLIFSIVAFLIYDYTKHIMIREVKR